LRHVPYCASSTTIFAGALVDVMRRCLTFRTAGALSDAESQIH
jgi:hypothetical protein